MLGSTKEEMFLKFGYSKVTMDEIASISGISKKTLYIFFPSKEELVSEIILKIKCDAQDCIDSIFSNNELDFIDKLENLMSLIRILSSKFEGPLLEDLHKGIPELWQHNWLFKSYFEERGYWDKAKYEDEFESTMEELNNKIKLLDEKIETLQSLEKTTSQK